MTLVKIISGGQTGADQAGLFAALKLKLETGGMMPKGFLTENGQMPRFAKVYGMQEHPTSNRYPPRTEWNVRNSDGTFIFGDPDSRGSQLTNKLCNQWQKPFFIHIWKSKENPKDYTAMQTFLVWLQLNNIQTLNVAGNRESSQPGIYQACYDFLFAALSNVKLTSGLSRFKLRQLEKTLSP